MDDVYSLSRGIIPTRHRPVVAISNDAHIVRITAQLLQEPNPTHEQIMTFLTAASYSVDGIVQEVLQTIQIIGFEQ